LLTEWPDLGGAVRTRAPLLAERTLDRRQ